VQRKKLDAVEKLYSLTKEFLDKKLISWPLADLHESLPKHPVFAGKPALLEVLRKRVNQHNIRIASLYYEKIRIERCCSLMKLTQKELEAEVSELVVNKTIYARIDRPAGIIRFGKLPTSEARLNGWAGSIDKVLDLVQETCHLIQKERMIQEARAKIKKK